MSESKSLPYFPFYVNDWLSSSAVQKMDYEMWGVYLHLLIMQWQDGIVTDDKKALRNYLKLDTRKFNRIVPNILRFFDKVEGGYINKRLCVESDKASEISKKRREAANSRWGVKPVFADANADAIASRLHEKNSKKSMQNVSYNSEIRDHKDLKRSLSHKVTYLDTARTHDTCARDSVFAFYIEHLTACNPDHKLTVKMERAWLAKIQDIVNVYGEEPVKKAITFAFEKDTNKFWAARISTPFSLEENIDKVLTADGSRKKGVMDYDLPDPD